MLIVTPCNKFTYIMVIKKFTSLDVTFWWADDDKKLKNRSFSCLSTPICLFNWWCWRSKASFHFDLVSIFTIDLCPFWLTNSYCWRPMWSGGRRFACNARVYAIDFRLGTNITTICRYYVQGFVGIFYV